MACKWCEVCCGAFKCCSCRSVPPELTRVREAGSSAIVSRPPIDYQRDPTPDIRVKPGTSGGSNSDIIRLGSDRGSFHSSGKSSSSSRKRGVWV